MSEDDFRDFRSALASKVWGWLESMNKERGANCCAPAACKLIKDDPRFYTDDCYGEALLVLQTYAAANAVEGMDIDATRAIDIRIGHTADWTPAVRISSSLHDRPLDDIVGGTEAALREAIEFVHGEIFQGWPRTKEEIDEFTRRQLPDEPQ